MDRFAGFTPDTLRFFAELKRNNRRPWFERNKQRYLDNVLIPARAFVMDMGQALGRMAPAIVADPSASIFRIYKDTRFSGDKSPYKTHLGVFFWEGPGRKMDRPGFYFELDDAGVKLYFGWYLFPSDILGRFREAVADDARGARLVRAIRQVRKAGIEVGGQFYKRLPRGLSMGDSARADLLRHNTLYTEQDCGRVRELFSRSLVAYCARQWKCVLPIERWIARELLSIG